MPYRVYILECSDGSYYTGSAADVEKRLWQHQEGIVPSAYTYSRRPVKLYGVRKKFRDILKPFVMKDKSKAGAEQKRKR